MIDVRRLVTLASFEMRPNEILYLGNLHLETQYRKTVIGLLAKTGAEPTATDRSERDIELFQALHPRFRSWPVRVDIPDLSSW